MFSFAKKNWKISSVYQLKKTNYLGTVFASGQENAFLWKYTQHLKKKGYNIEVFPREKLNLDIFQGLLGSICTTSKKM